MAEGWTRRGVLGSATAAGLLTSTPIFGRSRQADWLRSSGGIYCATPVSAGAVTLMFQLYDRWALSNRIRHFSELPRLLDEARRFGTDIVYLVDWYEGRADLRPEAYWWNKGDYRPRADLGGADALEAGLAAIRERGGRTISYLEPFVISRESTIGRERGEQWSIRTEEGLPLQPYPQDYKLCPANPAWQEYLSATAERLIGELGFSGLFLDSYGYQQGWRCVAGDHAHPPDDHRVFNRGVYEVVRIVGEAARSRDPEAVVLIEGPTFPPLFEVADGSFDWGPGTVQTRAGVSEPALTDVFTSSWSLDGLHEIGFLGHKYVWTPWWLEEVPASVDTCTRAIFGLSENALPLGDKFVRRYHAEHGYRTLHRWRNAGLLRGVDVPSIGDLTPERWRRSELFETMPAFRAHLEALDKRAAELDALLGPVSSWEGGWPDVVSHACRLTEARRAAAPWIDAPGAVRKVLEGPADGFGTARFQVPHSPEGPLIAAWNRTGGARVVDGIDGARVRALGPKGEVAGAVVRQPAHSLGYYPLTDPR